MCARTSEWDLKIFTCMLYSTHRILKVIYDIYPFTISVMLSNTDMVARRFDDVVTSAIEVCTCMPQTCPH